MGIPAVPIRTAMFDASGNVTRPWILFWQSLGSSGIAAAAGYSLINTDAGIATPNLAFGAMLELVLDIPITAIASPSNSAPGSKFSLLLQQDSTGGRQVSFSADYIGIDPSGFDTTASTFIVMEFSTRGDGKWYKSAGPTAPLPVA